MTQNLLGKLLQVEIKQSKDAEVRANIRFELDGEICSNTFFKIIER